MADEEKIEEEAVYEEGDGGQSVKDKIDKLRKKLKECVEEKQRNLAGWQRAQADFVNYRRRQEEQMGEWLRTAEGGLIKDILPVLDSLDAAIMNQELMEDAESMAVMKKQLMEILRRHGLEEIVSAGEKFDPQFHEVVECEECEAGEESGIVTDEIHKGYKLNGKVIRTAKVKVKK